MSDGTLVVCEFGNNRLQRFTPQGQSVESGAAADGTWASCAPWGVEVSPSGLVYVVDAYNNRVADRPSVGGDRGLRNSTGMSEWIPISFEDPWQLLWLGLIPALVLLSLRSLAGLERGRRILAIAARSVVTGLVVCCLARIQYVRTNHDLAVMFVVDRSKSIPDDPEQGLVIQQEKYIRDVSRKMAKDDRLGIITFDGQAYVEQLPMRGGMHLGALPQTTMRDRTDIGKAIRLAMATLPPETAKRIVLMTDGTRTWVTPWRR